MMYFVRYAGRLVFHESSGRVEHDRQHNDRSKLTLHLIICRSKTYFIRLITEGRLRKRYSNVE